MPKLYLASSSPRRREILTEMGLSFEVFAVGADETLEDAIAPDAAVLMLAERKAMAAAEMLSGMGVTGFVALGADTVVALDGKIFGKPKDAPDAARMLAALSDKTHTVFTGIAAASDDCTASDEGGGGIRIKSSVSSARVTFRGIKSDEIDGYIRTGEPLDKAGAYGIQGIGGVFVTKIEGDYFAVVGLSKCVSAKLLADFGIDVFKENTDTVK
ncbi:MAG: Maf family protein [Firmicutes bacterium]|nr:Maf family protein [Bacillota bacterium]